MLPDLDGFEVCRRVARRAPTFPSSCSPPAATTTDRIVGLELGADDYLPKPFNPRELLARLRAVLRRRAGRRGSTPGLRFGRLEIDRDARVRCAWTARARAHLATSSSCCVALAENAGRVMTPRGLAWTGARRGRSNRSTAASTSTSPASAPRSRTTRAARGGILTVRGAGYVFARRQDGEDAS